MAVSALTLLLLTGPAVGAPEDVANDIASEVMSPYCPGVTLHDCPSEAAGRLRARIIRWADAGMSRADILGRLEDEFGSSIRAVPPAGGTGLLAWLLPGTAVALGLGAAWALIARWNSRARANVPPISPEDRRRVNLALHAFRRRT